MKTEDSTWDRTKYKLQVQHLISVPIDIGIVQQNTEHMEFYLGEDGFSKCDKYQLNALHFNGQLGIGNYTGQSLGNTLFVECFGLHRHLDLFYES